MPQMMEHPQSKFVSMVGMDPHGVPQKINRHVFKAIHFYMNHKNGSSFPEIYNFVKFCNKNLSPVSNLKDIVRKSLNNLHRVGLVQRDRMKFKTRPGIIAKKTQGKKKSETNGETKENNPQPDNLQKNKKRKNSESSLDSETEGNATKRLRGGKKKAVEERKGKKTDLPRARRHQGGGSNVPTNFASLGTANSKVNLEGKESDEHKSPRGISTEDQKMDIGTDDQSAATEFRAPSESSLHNRPANELPFDCAEHNNNTINV